MASKALADFARKKIGFLRHEKRNDDRGDDIITQLVSTTTSTSSVKMMTMNMFALAVAAAIAIANVSAADQPALRSAAMPAELRAASD